MRPRAKGDVKTASKTQSECLTQALGKFAAIRVTLLTRRQLFDRFSAAPDFEMAMKFLIQLVIIFACWWQQRRCD